MTIKIQAFDFGQADADDAGELQFLSVTFKTGGAADGIKFLSALAQFVGAFDGLMPTAVTVATATVVPPPSEPAPVKAAEPEPAKPRTRRQAAPAPAVVESVTPPLAEPAPAPKVPAVVSAPPAVTAPAIASTPSPAPTDPIVPPAPSAAAPAVTPASAIELVPTEQLPPELVQAKSFREVMTFIYYKLGLTTQEAIEACCRAHANAPVIGRMLGPQADPNATIEKRIEFGIAVFGKQAAPAQG